MLLKLTSVFAKVQGDPSMQNIKHCNSLGFTKIPFDKPDPSMQSLSRKACKNVTMNLSAALSETIDSHVEMAVPTRPQCAYIGKPS